MAIIALEVEECDVSEDEGTVNVCVVILDPEIPCPVEFSFNLVFITNSITAGIYTTYYIHLLRTLYYVMAVMYLDFQRPMLTISLHSMT